MEWQTIPCIATITMKMVAGKPNIIWKSVQRTIKWNAPATAKPLNDFQKGTDYLSGIGVIPTYAMMTTKTLNYLVESEQIKNAFITQSGKNVDFLDKATAKEIIARKTGLTPIINDKNLLITMEKKRDFSRMIMFPLSELVHSEIPGME